MYRSPFHAQWQRLEATFFEYRDWELPLHFGDARGEHARVREQGGMTDASSSGVVRISGQDARSFLDRMSTIDMKKFKPGECPHGMLLDSQGKIVSLFRLLFLNDQECLLVTQTGLGEATRQHLEKYHISERLEITEETGNWAMLSLAGQKAPAVAATAGLRPSSAPPTAFHVWSQDGREGYALAGTQTGEPGVDFLLRAADASWFWDTHAAAWLGGFPPFGMDAQNTLRFEAGHVIFGMEVDASIIPLEARLDDWVPQNQGCYLGQEVVERIRTHKNVPKLLTGFWVDGPLPLQPGLPIEAAGRQVGVIVNSMFSPTLNRMVAAGYVKRQSLDANEPLTVPGRSIERASWPLWKPTR